MFSTTTLSNARVRQVQPLSTCSSEREPPKALSRHGLLSLPSYSLDETKKAIACLIQAGLIDPELKATFSLPTLPLEEDDYKMLEERLQTSFQIDEKTIFCLQEFLSKLIEKRNIPISSVQIIGSAIPISRNYHKKLFSCIQAQKQTLSDLQKIIEKKQESWTDLDIRIKIKAPSEQSQSEILQTLDKLFKEYKHIHRRGLHHRVGVLYTIGNHATEKKLDLTFIWDTGENAHMFVSDSVSVEILSYLQDKRHKANLLCNGPSIADWFLQNHLRVVNFEQAEEKIDKTYFPKLLCLKTKGSIPSSKHLEKKLLQCYFNGVTNAMDTCQLLQNSRFSHLPNGVYPSIAYWINAYEACKTHGIPKERQEDLFLILSHVKDEDNKTKGLLPLLQQKGDVTQSTITALKIVAIGTYLQKCLDTTSNHPITPTLFSEEFSLEYPLDIENPDHSKVCLTIDMAKEVETLKKAGDVTALLPVFERLCLCFKKNDIVKLQEGPFHVSYDAIRNAVFLGTPGTALLSLFFLHILTQAEGSAKYLNISLELLQRSLLESKKHEEILLSCTSLLPKPFLLSFEKKIQKEAPTPKSCRTAVLESILEQNDPHLFEQGLILLEESPHLLEETERASLKLKYLKVLPEERASPLFAIGMERKEFVHHPESSLDLLFKFVASQHKTIKIQRTLEHIAESGRVDMQSSCKQAFDTFLQSESLEAAKELLLGANKWLPDESYLFLVMTLLKKGLAKEALSLLQRLEESHRLSVKRCLQTLDRECRLKVIEALWDKNRALVEEEDLVQLAASWIGKKEYTSASEALRLSSRKNEKAASHHRTLFHIFLDSPNQNLELASFHLERAHCGQTDAYRIDYHELMDAKAKRDGILSLRGQELFPEEVKTWQRWERHILEQIESKEVASAIEILNHVNRLPGFQVLSQSVVEKLVHSLALRDKPLSDAEVSSLLTISSQQMLPLLRQLGPSEMRCFFLFLTKHSCRLQEQWRLLTACADFLQERKKSFSHLAEPFCNIIEPLENRERSNDPHPFLHWAHLMHVRCETKQNALKELYKSKFWPLASGEMSEEMRRKLIRVSLNCVMKAVFHAKKPPYNQIPLLWLAYAMQSGFDRFPVPESDAGQEEYAAAEVLVTEKLSQVRTYTAFSVLARERMEKFDQLKNRTPIRASISKDTRSLLDPSLLQRGWLFRGKALLFGAILYFGLRTLVIHTAIGLNRMWPSEEK